MTIDKVHTLLLGLSFDKKYLPKNIVVQHENIFHLILNIVDGYWKISVTLIRREKKICLNVRSGIHIILFIRQFV